MTIKKSTDKTADVKPTPSPKLDPKGRVLCEIPQQNIQDLFDWLNSDNMMMPQNQVRQCLALLNEATLTEK